MELLGLLQQGEQARGDPHRLARSAGIQVRNFAARAKQAELPLQLFDHPQRLLACRPERGGVVAVQHDLESRRHGMAGKRDGGHRMMD